MNRKSFGGHFLQTRKVLRKKLLKYIIRRLNLRRHAAAPSFSAALTRTGLEGEADRGALLACAMIMMKSPAILDI
jgi:hypothetical protein